MSDDQDFERSLEELELKQRVDDAPEPVSDDPADAHLEWAQNDERLRTAFEAARQGEMTPAEALDHVAAALGYDSPVVEDDDGYDY